MCTAMANVDGGPGGPGGGAAGPRSWRRAGWWRAAPFASVLAEPLVIRACTVVAGLQIGLTAARIPAWPCMFYHVTGQPCPGCGLTRSCVSLLHGDVAASLRYHLFGPLLLGGILLMAVLAVLPKRWRVPVVRAVAAVERRTGVALILLLAFCLYWPLRLAGIFPLPA